MDLIEFVNADLEEETKEQITSWMAKNRDRLLQCQRLIQTSSFPQELEAHFFMWDCSQKYWTEGLVCIVKHDGIYVVSEGYGDPQDGKQTVFNLAEINF